MASGGGSVSREVGLGDANGVAGAALRLLRDVGEGALGGVHWTAARTCSRSWPTTTDVPGGRPSDRLTTMILRVSAVPPDGSGAASAELPANASCAARSTCSSIGRPPSACVTLGKRERIRVPLPAASTTTPIRRVLRKNCSSKKTILRGEVGSGARIRTWDGGSKVHCLTAWPRRNEIRVCSRRTAESFLQVFHLPEGSSRLQRGPQVRRPGHGGVIIPRHLDLLLTYITPAGRRRSQATPGFSWCTSMDLQMACFPHLGQRTCSSSVSTFRL